MPTILGIEDFLAAGLPMIDVRSPGEFTQGHIPGAFNLPLFSDGERAVVGTLYKQAGRQQALLEGLRLVGPKLAGLVEQARALAPGGRVGIHCWRGGERSASMAWLLEKTGGLEVAVLRQGYKAFRHHVINAFSQPWRLQVVGGFTGTGKTMLLGRLQAKGCQVVDLEGLARHKGSAFGGIGEPPQPSTEHFENLIWDKLHRMDPRQAIWVEDESVLVGRAKIPDAFFARMRSAPVLFVDLPQQVRVERLVKEYGQLPAGELAAAIQRIQKRLGPQHAKSALEALDNGDLHTVARITLTYYDKTYARGLAARDPSRTRTIHAEGLEPDAIIDQLIEHAHARADGHPVDPV